LSNLQSLQAGSSAGDDFDLSPEALRREAVARVCLWRAAARRDVLLLVYAAGPLLPFFAHAVSFTNTLYGMLWNDPDFLLAFWGPWREKC
jgi:hypothetical protein